ncbi:MAG TPA: matrixin family metalloprotease, partial [Pseudobdellovibrionaceae bacterium]|nr:matrixin family metalloprotease [Pseudobdellovibrionaceae bacterium]
GRASLLDVMTEPSHRIAGRDKYLSLYLVVAHEIGHILGLDHPRDEGQLMGRKILETTRGMGEGDTEGIRILYGRPR